MPATRRALLATTLAVASGCAGPRSGGIPRPGSPDLPPFARRVRQLPHDELGVLSLGDGPGTPTVFAGSAAPDPRATGANSTGTDDADHALHALSLHDGREQWRADVPDPVRTAPTYAGSDDAPHLVFATGRESVHGEAYAIRSLDPDTGERVWDFDTDDRRFLSPVAATTDSVFVGRRDDQLGAGGEYVYALDAVDGAERWRTETGDVVGAVAARRHDVLVVRTFGDRVLALDAESGDERWREYAESVAYDDRAEQVFVEGHDTVRALAVTDGSECWRHEFDDTIRLLHSVRTLMSESVFVGADARLLALEPLTGETRWTLSVDESGANVERGADRVFVTSGEEVRAVDPASGRRQWSFAPDGEGPVGVSASRTVFASTERHLWALDPETCEERWAFVLGNDAAAASDSASTSECAGVATAGDLAFVAIDGAVYALDGSESA